MKIDAHTLQFPKSLPNDEQHFMAYYPYKFPKVIEHFERTAKELYDKPEAYAQFVQDEFQILEKAVNKVNEEYEKGDQTDLAFLVTIDQKFNKIFCFKFWVINYVFADGPLHEFYVDQLKAFARKMVDAVDDVEEYEQRIIHLQRDLLQTDYADIYLVQALHGVIVMDFFENDAFSKPIVDKIIPLIDQHDDKNNQTILDIWKPIVDRMLDPNDQHYSVLKDKPPNFHFNTLLDLPPLNLPITQTQMRKSPFPLYAFLNHTLEFRHQNKDLKERHDNMKATIETIFEEAKGKFTEEDYTDFRLSYEMSRCFSMSKDIMGNVDPILIPVWQRGLHQQVYEILAKDHAVRYPSVNHSAMFNSFVWYLPDDLKSQVMSVDDTDFSLEAL